MPFKSNSLSNISSVLECKELILNTSLVINVDDTLSCVRKEIDTDKFKTWLNANLNKFQSKDNPNTYFKKSFETEYNKGTFDLKIQIPNTQVLISAIREKGIAISNNDSAFLSVLYDYLLNYLKVDRQVLIDLNRNLIDYLQEGQTFNHYKQYLKKSKTLRNFKIEWDCLEDKAKLLIKCWEEML